jgi:2-phospho-L-lactate guanylyltransferase
MQATVATFDSERREGTALLDSGAEIAIPRDAFDASGLRLLRLGQRLRFELDGDGRVARVSLVTM